MLEKRKSRPYKEWDEKQLIIFSQLVLDNTETPDQKRCEYCHAPFKPILEIKHPIEGLDNAYLTADVYIRENKIFLEIDSYDEGGETKCAKLLYCPMCRRRLATNGK